MKTPKILKGILIWFCLVIVLATLLVGSFNENVPEAFKLLVGGLNGLLCLFITRKLI